MVTAVLHHVSWGADDPRWALLARALASGDVVVLLERAASDCAACVARIDGVGALRWCVPEAEHRDLLPAPVERLDDCAWWALIEASEVLLEWA